MLEDIAVQFRVYPGDNKVYLEEYRARMEPMIEPENQTLRVLIEFRNEFRQFKAETEQRFARIDERLAHIEQRLDHLAQSFSGMVMGNQYLLGGIQGRFENTERRLTVLEQDR
jgi:hypothetical protein